LETTASGQEVAIFRQTLQIYDRRDNGCSTFYNPLNFSRMGVLNPNFCIFWTKFFRQEEDFSTIFRQPKIWDAAIAISP